MEKTAIFKKTWMMSLLMTLFISYPNLAWFTCDLMFVPEGQQLGFFIFFICRFVYLLAVIDAVLHYNFYKLTSASLVQRIWPNVGFALAAFLLYEAVKFMLHLEFDMTLMIPTFQFFIIAVMSITIGYMAFLYTSRQEKEDELQQLRIESLQSRCSALMNQINPHFFFNSLNGISSLVRKKNESATIDYINELSDIFRYILQSENKGLVTLEEELDFMQAYAQVLQVRYANKLSFEIDVPEEVLQRKLPVLSLLPLLENITVHNIIDSEHHMTILVGLTEQQELFVKNPVFPKTFEPETHGTGLKNLQKRFILLMDKELTVKQSGNEYCVILPLA